MWKGQIRRESSCLWLRNEALRGFIFTYRFPSGPDAFMEHSTLSVTPLEGLAYMQRWMASVVPRFPLSFREFKVSEHFYLLWVYKGPHILELNASNYNCYTGNRSYTMGIAQINVEKCILARYNTVEYSYDQKIRTEAISN